MTAPAYRHAGRALGANERLVVGLSVKDLHGQWLADGRGERNGRPEVAKGKDRAS